MTFTRAAFSPTDGIKNTTTYPTNPVDETAARKQVQDNLDQMKDAINTLETELEASGAAAKVGCTGGTYTNIQQFINAVIAAGSGSTPGEGVVTNAMMATDVKIGSLAALNTTDKDSIVEAINELKAAITRDNTPAGVIRMWSGTIANIPSGNVLCDGTNGTPDLRNRFIMGAPDQAGMNTTGGSNTTTLTIAQLPAHNHPVVMDAVPPHTHTSLGADSGKIASYVNDNPSILLDNGTTTTSSGGGHTPTGTTTNTGSGSSYDSRPAYYALAFIMRTA